MMASYLGCYSTVERNNHPTLGSDVLQLSRVTSVGKSDGCETGLGGRSQHCATAVNGVHDVLDLAVCAVSQSQCLSRTSAGQFGGGSGDVDCASARQRLHGADGDAQRRGADAGACGPLGGPMVFL